MALSFLYRLVRRVIDAVRVHRLETAAKHAEILVFRHQLAVLHRHGPPPARGDPNSQQPPGLRQ